MARFLFADESWISGKDIRRITGISKVYGVVLTGIIVPDSSILLLERALTNIRLNLQLNSLKELRKVKDRSAKLDATRQISAAMSDASVKIISVIFLGRGKRYGSQASRYLFALAFLRDRFFYELRSSGEWGMIFLDSLPKDVMRKIRSMEHSVVENFHHSYFGSNPVPYAEKLYPQPFFVDDTYSSILQATDLVCLSVHSAYLKWAEEVSGIDMLDRLDVDELPDYSEYLSIYWPLFRRSRTGSVRGYGVKLWFESSQ